MNMETHMKPIYTLTLTQDEYIAVIVAIFSSSKENINKSYNNYFSFQAIDNMDRELYNLAGKFQQIYKKETLIDIIKTIRLNGLNIKGEELK